MSRSQANEPSRPRRWPEFVIAVAAFLLIVAELDPTGTYAWLPDGPGLTVDEVLNVQQGVRTEVGLGAWLSGRITLRQLFGDAEMLGPRAPLGYHAADYPPWGRYLLGLAHAIVTTFAFPADWETPFVVAAARFASAIAFAVTVWLVSRYATDSFGRTAGVAAAAALLLMPRVFGHAHLASLETIIGLFYTATLLSIARRWRSGASVSNGAAVIAGLWWGLAMLVKIQAIFIPPVVTLWAFYHWRWRAVRPLAIMAVVGMATFFVGWPWLWFDPLDHLLAYFRQTTHRAVLPVWYMGRVWQDVNAPWHYPFVMTMVTVPLGIIALSAWGLVGGTDRAGAGWRRPDVRLLVLGFMTPLVLFALPGVAVYDGVRLFLVAFPPLAIVAGRGGGLAWTWLRRRLSGRVAGVVAVVLLVVSATPALMTRPVYLSSYNWSVAGLAGAERLGFEVNYWADALTSDILNAAARKIPKGGTLAVSPVLHQFQLDALLAQTPSLRARDIHLVEYGRPGAAGADGLLIYERRASLPATLEAKLDALQPTALVERQGVRLAALYIPSPQLPTPKTMTQLSHIDDAGASRMVDVADKPATVRTATAEGFVSMTAETLSLIESDQFAKGNVREVARVAGIMAAKRTADLIPLCHPLPIDAVNIDIASGTEPPGLRIRAQVRTTARTGVEMEALTAATVAALTVYDMCKSADRAMTVGPFQLLEKSGGQSGTFQRPHSTETE